jgi:hypothetical protein
MTTRNVDGRQIMAEVGAEGEEGAGDEEGSMRLDIDSIRANHAVSLRQEGEH